MVARNFLFKLLPAAVFEHIQALEFAVVLALVVHVSQTQTQITAGAIHCLRTKYLTPRISRVNLPPVHTTHADNKSPIHQQQERAHH